MVEHYFLYPFGTAGTLASVPNPTQVSGTVSYQSGFPIGYQTASSDPGYLSIPRDQFNQILYDVTGAIQQIQQTGLPSWITAAANGGVSYSYPLGAAVWYNGVPYRSLQAGNTDTPPTSNWAVIGQSRTIYFNYAADTGSANHYAIAPDPAISAYAGGDVIQLRPAFANTGACDINVNSLGVKNIKTLANVDPAAGMINPAGQYQLVYNDNTGCFVLQNPTLGSAAYVNTGTSAGQVPLNSSLGTAAYLNVGTSASQVVQLNGSAQLPAVSGALLTSLPAQFTTTAGSTGKIVFGAVTVQWGIGTANASGTGSANTFGTAFSGTPYGIVCTTIASSYTSFTTGDRPTLMTNTMTTTGFKCLAGDNTTSMFYIAIGPT